MLRLLSALVVGAVLASACGSTSDGAVQFDRPDRVIAGPQGAVGQFVVECLLSHRAADDPIVHPGEPGGSHLHQFFGATDVHADSSYNELISSSTTCEQLADTASYWAPVLVDAEQVPIEPIRSVAYYRAGPDVTPTAVTPFPANLMLVAGDQHATEPQPLSVVAWSCGVGAKREVTPPNCEGAESLRFSVVFPDCWNGVELTSSDFADPGARHVVYSDGGGCPASHPVHVPQLQFAIDYPPVDPGGLALSSGAVTTGHSDFWNAWDQEALTKEVTTCIHRELPCGVGT
jgi:hypothetical protein